MTNVLSVTEAEADALMMTTEGKAVVVIEGAQSDYDPAVYYRPYRWSTIGDGERVHVLLQRDKWTRSLGWWRIKVGPALDTGIVWFDFGDTMPTPKKARPGIDFVAVLEMLPHDDGGAA